MNYLPMQRIELFVAQRIAVLPLQNRYSGAILGQSTFKNPLLRPFTGLLFCGYKINDFQREKQIDSTNIATRMLLI
jgi:hypothetical protein